jgi:alkanesulfonate monooxygenase SsuD/methylene tetrahydromethanopterin reductase-like flavin-dependent oxidoreductase (luciferase family)
VGGHHDAVREVAAADADGWNAWGVTLDRFTEWAAETRNAARRPDFACSWGGLAVLDDSDDAARERATRLDAGVNTLVGGPGTIAETIAALGVAGAQWVILGALDPRDPRTATILGEQVAPKVATRVG